MVKPLPQPLYVFHDIYEGATSVRFETLKDGRTHLLTGSAAGMLKIWDLQIMKCVSKQSFEASKDNELSSASGCSILNCGKWSSGVWAHCRTIGIRFWSIDDNFQLIEHCIIPCDFVGFCGCTVLTQVVNDTSTDHLVVFLEKLLNVFEITETSQKLTTTVKYPNQVGMPICAKTCALSQPTLHLLIGFENGDCHLFNCRQSIFVSSLKICEESVMCLDIHSESGWGIAGSVDNKLRLFNIDLDCNLVMSGKHVELPFEGVGALAIRHDRKIFACGCWNGDVRVFSCKSSKPLAVLNLHTESIHCLTFDTTLASAYGKEQSKFKYFAAGSKDGTVSLWSLYE